MYSPESSSPATSTASETAHIQDSPVFSYISNLSPIQPVKVASVAQGFPGLNSPPLVFTSPQLNLQHQPSFLKRAQYPRTSFAELQEQLEDSMNSATAIKRHEKLDIQLSSKVFASKEKASDSNSSVDELIQSPLASGEQFLEDIVNADSADPTFSFDSTIRISEEDDKLADAPTCSKENLVTLQHEFNSEINEELPTAPPVINKQTEQVQQGNILIHVSASENDIRQGNGVSVHCPKIGPELPAENAFVNQDEDDCMAENAEAGQNAPLDQSSNVLAGSNLNGNENKNVVVTTGATLTGPSPENVPNNLQAFQNRGGRRRCLQFEDAQHNIISNRLVHDHPDGEGAESLSLETPSVPISGKLHPINALNYPINLPKPSGIGLHLNSIVNSMQVGSSAKINLKAAQDCVAAKTVGNKQESHACVSNNPVTSKSMGKQSTLGNKRRTTEKGSGLEKINNLRPKKKRKNTTDSGDGCKGCNCKNSKCLKLYCECFAAGRYCEEPCACQDCFNRPEYEDKVIERREKIESRDSLAFAPRVVQRMIKQPTISCGEDDSNFTPASARHKKGCNCKKSMCLKKYCECYQANVGCSDGCRCEGCKNVFGQKGEYGMTNAVFFTGEDAQETTVDPFVQKCELDAYGNHTYNTDFVNQHNLTPLTPAFQFSNHGKDASKTWFPSAKYFQTPESGFTYAVAPYKPSDSPRNSDTNVPADNILELVSFDHKSRHGKAEIVGECSQTPAKMGSLSDLPNVQMWADNLKQQYFPANKFYPSGSSLDWREWPMTPMTQFSGSKVMKEAEFDFGLPNMQNDDTPRILKDSATSVNTVKVSSPNKKRVSPPYGRVLELGSSSAAAGVRSGRKFILTAVPSFPPLTPCVDSKTPGVQHRGFPANHPSKK